MKQYNRIKVKHPDTVLLFRVDSYETFGVMPWRRQGAEHRADQARKRQRLRGGTRRLPASQLGHLPAQLVKSGLKVAVCDQLEDPNKPRAFVKRGGRNPAPGW